MLEEQLRELARYFLNFFPPNHLDVPTRVSLRVWSCKHTTRNNFLPVRGKLPCAQTLPRRTGSDLGWGTPKREGGGKKKEKEALRLVAVGPALLEGGNSSTVTASGERHRFLQRPRGRRQPFPFAVLGFFFPQKIKRPRGRSPPVSSWTQP